MSTRRKLDAYPTPAWATQQLVSCLGLRLGGGVVEPCAGDRAIARILDGMNMQVLTNDIGNYDVDYHADATNPLDWPVFERQCKASFHRSIDWVVTNPPFKHAPAIARLAIEHATSGVALLLRLSFLEPCPTERAGRRDEFWRAHPLSKLIVLPRLSFTNNRKTDSVTCAWYVWEKGSTKQEIIIVPKPSGAERAHTSAVERDVLARSPALLLK